MYDKLITLCVCDVNTDSEMQMFFSTEFNYKSIFLKDELFSLIAPHPESKPLYKTVWSHGLPCTLT